MSDECREVERMAQKNPLSAPGGEGLMDVVKRKHHRLLRICLHYFVDNAQLDSMTMPI